MSRLAVCLRRVPPERLLVFNELRTLVRRHRRALRIPATKAPRVRGPLRITHSGSQPLKRPRASIPLIFPGGGYFHAPCGAGSLAVGKRSDCVFRPQVRTNSGMEYAVSIRERTADRRRIGSPVQRLRDTYRATRRLDLARYRAPRRRALRPHLERHPLAAAPAPVQGQ
jgi:hypothetical protein